MVEIVKGSEWLYGDSIKHYQDKISKAGEGGVNEISVCLVSSMADINRSSNILKHVIIEAAADQFSRYLPPEKICSTISRLLGNKEQGRYVRQCLPEKYKSQTHVKNAKCPRKNKANVNIQTVAAISPQAKEAAIDNVSIGVSLTGVKPTKISGYVPPVLTVPQPNPSFTSAHFDYHLSCVQNNQSGSIMSLSYGPNMMSSELKVNPGQKVRTMTFALLENDSEVTRKFERAISGFTVVRSSGLVNHVMATYNISWKPESKPWTSQ